MKLLKSLFCFNNTALILAVLQNLTAFVQPYTESQELICSIQDLSLPDIFNCPDGQIGLGKNCVCGSESGDPKPCSLASTRSFLPPVETVLDEERHQICDEQLSSFFNFKFLERIRDHVTVEQGYPQHDDCSHDTCHTPSIGKYIRYSSFINYALLRKLSFGESRFVDLHYDYGWRWAVNVSQCQADKNSSWNCAFVPFSHPIHRKKAESLRSDENLFLDLFNRTMQMVTSNPNNAIQIVIYGKLLNLLTRPSDAATSYINDHLISLHPDSAQGSRFKAFGRVVSVSMHVRQGDSCDTILDHEVASMERYLSKDLKVRPCFAVNVYLKKLDELRARYNVSRVYLATDSQEMINRTYQRPEFNWIFINVSRQFLDKKNGWIDFREPSDYADILFSAVSDLVLLRRGDIFVGTFTSHYSKIAYYSMAGNKLRLPPFVSLDYPLSCDTIDNCADEDIKIRNQTIEEIIERAPECQHKHPTLKSNLEGRVNDKNDPCGIYVTQ